MSDHPDLDWHELTNVERSVAKRHLEHSFGKEKASALLAKDYSNLVKAHHMREHMASDGSLHDAHQNLNPLNPNAFGLTEADISPKASIGHDDLNASRIRSHVEEQTARGKSDKSAFLG